MIKLKSLLEWKWDETEPIDTDRIFWDSMYLDDVAEKTGYNTDFNEIFWGQPHIPTLYHCTTKENYELIKQTGKLEAREERRGAVSGNSSIGDAVFTTSESEEVPFFKHYYGPVVLAIDAKQMKADGFMPVAEMEPDWDKAKKIEHVLLHFGKDEAEAEAARWVDSSDQNTQGTVILYDDIPAKYLSVVEYD